MNEKDIKGILWLLERINSDPIMASYFREKLNHQGTDIVKLIKWFKDMVEINKDKPIFEIPLYTIKKENK